jgi:hypothetical protein
MYPNALSELTTAIKKLYTLEESIIYDEKLDSTDLRSKQALLISEVIQSLQDLESSMKREAHFTTITNQQDALMRV